MSHATGTGSADTIDRGSFAKLPASGDRGASTLAVVGAAFEVTAWGRVLDGTP
ncbi:MAG: hypothetical protein ACM31C_02455 [Acidobacteriota bacterium]